MKNACAPFVVAIFLTVGIHAGEFNFRSQEIANDLTVGYAVRLVDVNHDGKQDIVIVDSGRVLWYENPAWQPHIIIDGQTKRDNVSIAAHDIDGDGKVDFALAADWRPSDTRASGSLQWLRRGDSLDEKWTVFPIATEPTIHRIGWADVDADGASELLVVPLFGRGTRGPKFEEAPIRVLAFEIPADPTKDTWESTVLNEELHVAHNFLPLHIDGDEKLDVLVASFEGVSLLRRLGEGKWLRSLVGTGNQQTSPNRGASEIKRGKLADGLNYLATIEPWHGFQVVVYTQPESPLKEPLWTRHVLDDELQWGHAVWCANLDSDADEELIIGVRDNKDEAHRSGVRIYDPTAGEPTFWQRQLLEPAAVAVEDLVAGDLNADGKTDIVACGRGTKNVRIYWNETK